MWTKGFLCWIRSGGAVVAAFVAVGVLDFQRAAVTR